jgi:hypothetical protein
MTDWEIIERKGVGRGTAYGPSWDKFPAVAIVKGGISFNAKFCQAFVNGSGQALICVAKDARKLGIKIVPEGESAPEAFSIQKNGSHTNAKRLNLKAIPARFPDCVGYAYRAHTSADGKVIEVELSPENRCK